MLITLQVGTNVAAAVEQLSLEEAKMKDVGHRKIGDQAVEVELMTNVKSKILEEQFPMAKARGPDFLPPQSRVSGLFPGKAFVGRACKLQTRGSTHHFFDQMSE